MDYENIKLRNLKFVDYRKIAFPKKVARFLVFPKLLIADSPVQLNKSQNSIKSASSLKMQSSFNLSVFQALFPKGKADKIHNRQLIRWLRIIFVSMLLSGFLATLIPLLIYFTFLYSFTTETLMESDIFVPLFFTVFYLTLFLSLFVSMQIGARIATVLSLRLFADSICAITSTFIVLALQQNDVLSNPTKKKRLLIMVEILARDTPSLSKRFGIASDVEFKWSVEHFRQMVKYIRERERWIIAPTDSTLQDLRRDFYELASIYFYGNYGNFKWVADTGTPETPVKSVKTQALNTLPKVIGIVLPIVLFCLLLWQETYVTQIGIGINIIALILICWFLLAVDVALKLGVVASAVNLAKEIRGIK